MDFYRAIRAATKAALRKGLKGSELKRYAAASVAAEVQRARMGRIVRLKNWQDQGG
jgi:hypothetical protein